VDSCSASFRCRFRREAVEQGGRHFGTAKDARPISANEAKAPRERLTLIRLFEELRVGPYFGSKARPSNLLGRRDVRLTPGKAAFGPADWAEVCAENIQWYS
jgi:hypothetical protein